MGGGPKQKSYRNAETRHYCAVCNVWMGNDRQSILLHENGKKHKEKLDLSLQAKRDNKANQDKQAKQLQSSLKAMEQAAMQSLMAGPDAHLFDTSTLQPAAPFFPQQAYGAAAAAYPPPAAVSSAPPPPAKQQPSKNNEKKEWESRKRQRMEEKQRKEDGDEPDIPDSSTSSGITRRRIAPDEGHNTIANDNGGQTTYLEGDTFASLLEEELPIQLWTGSALATREEMKLLSNQSLWLPGLIVALRKKAEPVVDVAYLKSSNDTEETLIKGVALARVRIVLGADDDRIPNTLEEARLLAMGGEDIQVEDDAPPEIDEATGLAKWSTVSIRRTTVQQEEKEERDQWRAQQREQRQAKANLENQIQARKMEEAKVDNAEDSALGAFDVWEQSGKKNGMGYKGVDIHQEADLTVHDTGKRLAEGSTKVAFKKKSKMAGKKRNRRTTSADDDE